MFDGFVKVAAGSPKVAVADVQTNVESIRELIARADSNNDNLLVLPELCVTGYTCADLFYSEILLSSALSAVEDLARFTAGRYPVVIIGAPLRANGKLYNCAVALHDGRVLGVIPKTYLPNASEFYERRQFTC